MKEKLLISKLEDIKNSNKIQFLGELPEFKNKLTDFWKGMPFCKNFPSQNEIRKHIYN